MLKFETPAAVTAVVTIPAGRIQVIATDRTDTTVEVRPADPGKNRDIKAAEHTTVEYADGTLRIGTPEPQNQYFGPTGSIEVTIQVPSGSHLKAETASSELRGTGRLGEVVFTGAYQQIKIDEAASLQLTAIDGDVEIGRLAGPAKVTTARGAIRITEAVRGTVDLETQLGDITVGAAPGTSATLDANTGYGRVTGALKNDGTPALQIHASTAMGDITARSL